MFWPKPANTVVERFPARVKKLGRQSLKLGSPYWKTRISALQRMRLLTLIFIAILMASGAAVAES